ncbi:hypothetical protein QOZ80_4AG0301160 [Eleusine coracana subsp. coracana]|nr:hypothetical protein QOZ80_4AG0301160 [Eleusine coracana subsp. coracana]
MSSSSAAKASPVAPKATTAADSSEEHQKSSKLAKHEIVERSLGSTFGILIKLYHKAKPENRDEKINKPDMEEAKKVYYRTATGYAVGKENNYLKVITCAHTIGGVYGKAFHGITPDEVNTIYSIEVHCSHEEYRVLNKLGKGNRQLEDEPRCRAPAICIAIDPKKDLMLLQVDANAICSGEDNKDGGLVGITCPYEHPPIGIMTEQQPPKRLEPCVLQGWTPQRMSCLAEGSLSFETRPYDALTQINPKDYDMRLAEFTNLVAEEGCSGGAVVSLISGKSMGVYHGVVGGTKGYAMSTEDTSAQPRRLARARLPGLPSPARPPEPNVDFPSPTQSPIVTRAVEKS